MAFRWKARKDKFKGEGVYFLTFVVAGRRALLGELVPIEGGSGTAGVPRRPTTDGGTTDGNNADDSATTASCRMPSDADPHPELCTSKLARVRLTELGFAIAEDLQHIGDRYKGIKLCCKQIMPNHIHAVVWITRDLDRSILQIAHGFRIGITQIAERLGVWQRSPVDSRVACDATSPGLILDKPFVRTLSHKGQLRAMIDYVHANPDNSWLLHKHPELYTIHRRVLIAGMHFDIMGKARIIAYPDRQVIALPRKISQEDLDKEIRHATQNARRGVITYTAAMNDAERAVSLAVRAEGWPEVVMLFDGFPPPGSEKERFFHPNGVYHKACGEGRLLLIAPLPENYENSRLIALTDRELARKAAQKGMPYRPIPHSSTRWRMIAGNMMLKIIARLN